VLLVHDEEPEAADRCEHGGTRADDDRRFPAPYAAPLRPALARAEPAVQDGDPVAEPASHSLDELMGQRDLGDQHDHVPSGGERPFGGVEEHLGLSAAGDAVQQEGACAFGQRVREGVGRYPLLARERRADTGRRLRNHGADAFPEHRLGEPGQGERLEGAGATAGVTDCGRRQLASRRGGERPVSPGAGRCPAGHRRFLVDAQLSDQPDDALAPRGRNGSGHDGRDHAGERREVVAGGPAAELEQVFRDERVRV